MFKTIPNILILVLILILVTSTGCESGNSPVFPESDPVTSSCSTESPGTRVMWGLWNVLINTDHTEIDIQPVRSGLMHLNATGFLEQWPCTNCVGISNPVALPENRLAVDLSLTHPFPGNNKLTGFDVRAIFMTGSDYEFPESGRSIPWQGDYVRLQYPDGYTALYNPVEYDSSQPGPQILQYIEGKFAMGDIPDSTLNAYVSFRTGVPRRMFEAGGYEKQAVVLCLPDGPLSFGYAVDCCWKKAVGQVTDPVNDFPPGANCQEAYDLEIQIGSCLQPFAGSTTPVEVQVSDHQGQDTIGSVSLECPDLFAGVVELEYIEDVGPETHLYTGELTNEYGAGVGEYPLLIRITDTVADPNLGPVDAWFVYPISVGSSNGWVRTWGSQIIMGNNTNNASHCSVDPDGNVYVSGEVEGHIDMDPTEGECNFILGDYNIFLSKFSSDGDFVWSRIWEFDMDCKPLDLCTDVNGNVIVMGEFDGPFDIDPTDGSQVVDGSKFISKLDAEGNFVFGVAWVLYQKPVGIRCDQSGNVYMAGKYVDDPDFDPGPGIGSSPAIGMQDIYLLKLNPLGSFEWVLTWGGDGDGGDDKDQAYDFAVSTSDVIYVLGKTYHETDYDPGPGTYVHSASAFLSFFTPVGEYLYSIFPSGVDGTVLLDGNNNVYIMDDLYTSQTIDVDFGPDEVLYSGPGYILSRYDESLNYIWTVFFSDPYINYDFLNVDSTGEIYLSGDFTWDLADFDPTDEFDFHTSEGHSDIFLSKFLDTGEYVWTRTFGNTYDNQPNDLTADLSGNSYIVGTFSHDMDFDPGPGSELIDTVDKMCFLEKIPADGNW